VPGMGVAVGAEVCLAVSEADRAAVFAVSSSERLALTAIFSAWRKGASVHFATSSNAVQLQWVARRT
jgi:hypothetical protein